MTDSRTLGVNTMSPFAGSTSGNVSSPGPISATALRTRPDTIPTFQPRVVTGVSFVGTVIPGSSFHFEVTRPEQYQAQAPTQARESSSS